MCQVNCTIKSGTFNIIIIIQMAITMKELQYLLVPYGFNSRFSYDWPIGRELMAEMVRRFQADQDAQVEIDIDGFIAYLDADDDLVDAPTSPPLLVLNSPLHKPFEQLDGAEEAELAMAIALSLRSKRNREEVDD